MASTVKVERLRPEGMQAKPVRLDRVFDDPAGVIDLIEKRGPYITMAAFHHMEDRLGGPNTQPFFRGMFDDEILLHNPAWIAAARESFSAEIVRPFKCLAQLNGPMSATGVHVDLPLFRGLGAFDAPVWLMMNMTYSGLFHDWMVPVASGLAWFYRGVGGPFVYWPDVYELPQVERTLWNTGVMSDNEYMFHGVAPIGTVQDRQAVKGTLRASDTLHAVGRGEWEIHDHGRVVHHLRPDQLRMSLLWKAHVFRDERHLASFEDRSMDLTIPQVVDIYREDLGRRGIDIAHPSDPFNDPEWKALLETTYPQPLSPHAADNIV
jgi:hypothetical protein